MDKSTCTSREREREREREVEREMEREREREMAMGGERDCVITSVTPLLPCPSEYIHTAYSPLMYMYM